MSLTAIMKFGVPTGLIALSASTVPRPSVVSPSVHQVATLGTPRSVHTATTLHSGSVLIVGGMTDEGKSTADVELFEPALNATQRLTSLSAPRASHTATLLDDGRVLIAGGYNGEYLASVEIFDPSTRHFHALGSLLEGRSGHTATPLADGRVLFVGGVGRGWTFLHSAELFDPSTGRSEHVSPMNAPRESHTATVLADGRILVIGGHSGRRQNMEVYASAEIFDPRINRFEPAGTLATARHKHDAIGLADGRVLVIGGADRTDRLHYASTEVYDPADGSFEAGPSMAHRRYKIAGTSILLPNGDVLITSGADVAELLDVGGWAFRDVAGRFPAAYRFAAAALLPKGDVLIAGGYSEGIMSTDGIWRFGDPK